MRSAGRRFRGPESRSCAHAVIVLVALGLMCGGARLSQAEHEADRGRVHMEGLVRAVNVTTGEETIAPGREGLAVAPGDHLALNLAQDYSWHYVWTGSEGKQVEFLQRESEKTRDLVLRSAGQERVMAMRGRYGIGVITWKELEVVWPTTRGLISFDLQSSDVNDLSPVANAKDLRYLNLDDCYAVLSVEPLGQLSHLRVLNLNSCFYVTDISPLTKAKELTELDLFDCRGVQSLLPLAELPRLRWLRVEVRSSQDVAAVGRIESLAHLEMICRGDVGTLEPLGRLRNLERLRLSGFAGNDLSAVAALPGLRVLHVADASALSDLAALSRAPELRALHLWRCPQLADLSPLAKFERLEHLDLWYCQAVRHLAPLSGLHSLRVLELTQCPNVELLEPLGRMPNLQRLKIGVGCGVSGPQISAFARRNRQCEIAY